MPKEISGGRAVTDGADEVRRVVSGVTGREHRAPRRRTVRAARRHEDLGNGHFRRLDVFVAPGEAVARESQGSRIDLFVEGTADPRVVLAEACVAPHGETGDGD